MPPQTAESAAPHAEPELIRALMSPWAYPHAAADIRLIETHISWVLLTGEYAYKIKKPVDFGFLDFSTLEKRRDCCYEELRLNRRLAADWYLEVVPIAGSCAQPRVKGEGDAFEYAVKMRQFPNANTLKERAREGRFGPEEIDSITDLIADFHGLIAQAAGDSPFGDSAGICHWFEENFGHIRPKLKNAERVRQLQAIEDWGRAEWQAKADAMDRRKADGFVRECHGDLHLGNMTQIGGQIVLFDCIEFNPMLRWIDVFSEVAFLMIDLLHFGLDALAFRFLNRYLQQTGDYPGLSLLRYYLVYRALVLAKVSLLRAEQQQLPALRAQNEAEYGVYADLAERFTRLPSPRLLITHGFSGSGKSYTASRLAERLGAVQIRSDVERKRLHGFGAAESTGSGLDGGIYTAKSTESTYDKLAAAARAILDAGFTAIVDAAFLRTAERARFRELADRCGAGFAVLDFRAEDAVLVERIQARTGDASEATVEVLRRQQQFAEPLTAQEQAFAVSVNSADEAVFELLLARFA